MTHLWMCHDLVRFTYTPAVCSDSVRSDHVYYCISIYFFMAKKKASNCWDFFH